MYLSFGIDLSHSPNGFVLISEEGWRLETHFIPTRTSTESLVTDLQSQLAKHAKSIREITHLAVTLGPGNYTGCRVGLSMVKTLAQALRVPVFATGSLAALLLPFRLFDGIYFTCLPSVRTQWHTQLWSIYQGSLKPLSNLLVWTPTMMIDQLSKFHAPIKVVGQFPELGITLPYVTFVPAAIPLDFLARASLEFTTFTSWQTPFSTSADATMYATMSLNPIYAYPPTITV